MNYPLLGAFAASILLAACGQTQTDGENAASAMPVSVSAEQNAEQIGAESQSKPVKLGKALYESNCKACHGADGKGKEGTFPPLAQSDYFSSDSKPLIRAIVNGINGKITVNGKEYDSMMPASAMSDEDAANVATYILNSFGNTAQTVTAAEVAAERAK